MIHLKTPKFWLLTTAALICSAQMSAQAQVSTSYGSNYEYGAPTMVAAAPSLPTLRAEQIAQDVTTEYNPRTGRTEFVAAPFDPFEQDPSLAGSLKLRSADGGVAIDGQPLQGGAIVDIDFYYNSPSDDPYGGRNYGDASFVNGQLAPVVTRDTRILECSTRVENVIYDHTAYYSPSRHIGIYRPYRHYAGHSGFGFGFGSSYFGPGYGYYDRNRNRYSRIRGHSRTPRFVRGVNRDYRDDRDRYRDRDRVRDRNGDRVRDRDRDRDGTRQRRDDRAETEVTRRRGLTQQERRNRLRAMELHGSALPLSGAVRRNGRSTLRSAAPRDRIVIGTGPSQTQTESGSPKVTPRISRSDLKRPEGRRNRTASSARDAERGVSGRGSRTRISQPRSAEPRVSRPLAPESRAPEPRRAAPASRPAAPAVSRPSRAKDTKSRSQKSRAPKSRTSNSKAAKSRASRSRSAPSRPSNRGSRGRQMDFFPSSSHGGRSIVTSSAIDCAREDKLRVFVSNERLDAARFDGLTLIALDAQGHETPVYIPPNYIEGFRLAASGRIRPQGYQSRGQQSQDYSSQNSPSQGYQSQQPYSGVPVQVQPPSRRIEAAPCPSGTSKQPDGTCLQTRVQGYPYR